MGNDGIYSAGEDIVEQICQNSKTKCFTGISGEGLTCEIFAKTSCHDAFQSCAVHMASLRGKSSCKLLAKTPLIFNVVLSLHTLSHTQPIQ